MSMSSTSRARLALAHPDLIRLAEAVAEDTSIVILEAHREVAQEAQNIAKGVSHLKDPMDCLHCREPADAIDMAAVDSMRPVHDPIDWNDTNAFMVFAAKVKAKANELGLTIRWGGAWADAVNWTPNPPHSFNDLDHFERHNV